MTETATKKKALYSRSSEKGQQEKYVEWMTNEYNLIKNKKSNLSASKRIKLVSAFEAMLEESKKPSNEDKPKPKAEDKKAKKVSKKSAETPIETKWIDTFNLNELYIVKGLQGFYTIKNTSLSDGRITIQEWLGDKTRLVLKNLLSQLGSYYFVTNDLNDIGSQIRIPIRDVLDNIHNNAEYLTNCDFIDDVTMKTMVPNHDPEEFKPYHAKNMIKLYIELINATNDNEEL